MTNRRRRAIASVSLLLGCAGLVCAQQIWVGGGGYSRFAPRFATMEDFDGRFLYCRAFYQGGWSTDYPGADNNFSVRLAELTRIPVKFDPNRQPTGTRPSAGTSASR